MIHANQAVERAGSVAGVVIANHRGPRDRARELAIQHAEDVLLMAAGEGDAGEGVVVFVVGVTAKFFFKRMVRIRYPEVESGSAKPKALPLNRPAFCRGVGFDDHH